MSKHLRVSLLWSFIFIAAIPVSLLGFLSLGYFTSRVVGNIHAKNELIARSIARVFRNDLIHGQEILEQVAGFIESPERQTEDVSGTLDWTMRRIGFFETIYVISREGKLIDVGLSESLANKREDLLGLDFSNQPLFQAVLATRKPMWSDAFLSIVTGRVSLTLAVPLGLDILAASLDIDRMREVAREYLSRELMSISIIDRNGILMFHPDKETAQQKRNIGNLAPVREGLNGNEGTYNYELAGLQQLGSVARVPEIGWLVMVSQTREDAYAPMYRLRKLIILVIIAALMTAVIAAFRFASRLSRPFSQLASSASAIARGNYEANLPQQDHIETEALAESFRDMAEAIRERESTLKRLAQTMASATDSECFELIVQEVYSLLKADIALVGVLQEKEHIQAVAMLKDGRLVPEFSYTLEGTPCTRVLIDGFCEFPKGVRELFPEDKDFQEMGIEGYIGIALYDKFRNPIGIINAMSRRELSLPRHTREVLTIIAARAASEIERLLAVEEKAKLEEQLRQAQKMEALGRLAGGVAHDFNNLLQIISGYANMLLDDVQDNDETKKDLNEISQAADKATSLVRQLLIFSRKSPLQLERLNLNRTVGKLLEMLQRLIGEHIELIVTPEDDLPWIYVDPAQVEQIIFNLCVNARDAIPKGGKINIKTSSIYFYPEFLKDHPWAIQNDYVLLEISDSGVGIPPEVRERIFEPFFTTKEVNKGTGLGLSLVYSIAKRHRGEIEVDSEPGEGSTFRIYFPSYEGSGLEVKESTESQVSDLTGAETILVAEDDDMVRTLTSHVLRRAGYNLILAKDGAEAIELFSQKKQEIDIAILDVIMPKKGGRAVYDVIKAEKPELPVLFCSGYSDRELEADELGNVDFEVIQKPYRPHELLRRVKGIIGKSAVK